MSAAPAEIPGAPDAPARLGLRCFLAALGAALATGAACPPLEQTWLQFPGLVLVLRALDGLSARRSALVGLCAGLGMQVALFTWLATSTARLGHLSLGIALLLFVVHSTFAAGQVALVGLLDARVRAQLPAWRRALFPCAYVGAELVWPKVIPWTIGLPQQNAAVLDVAQVAELGGAPLLTLVVVAGACGLDAALEAARTRARRAKVEAAVGLGLVLLASLFGTWRLAALRAAPSPRRARVAIGQPGIVDTPFAPHPPGAVQAALESVARDIGAEGDVVLAAFPEAAAPFGVLELEPTGGAATAQLQAAQRRNEEALGRIARLCRCPTLIGVNVFRVRPGETVEASLPPIETRNALVLLDAQGRITDRYDKHELLTLAEYLPGEGALPFLRDVLPFAGRYVAGPGPRVLEAGSLAVAPLICFEAVPGAPARGALAQGDVDLLVNATNDVWFGGQGPDLHALAASLRAIETRRALVRTTTTGLSFFVLPGGTRSDELGPGVRRHLVRDLPLPADPEARTLHSRIGSILGWVAAMVLGVALIMARLNLARRR